ncbi:hypothetical protein ACFLIM_27360 [Nonomuraea sp. M3C6]|uniref:SAM-dependent methyltransferase n=1 Tax=Nonomuraea marmarensis TaxID=3351344 RepID=A0ABW7AKD7_9ACTN
MSEPAYLAAVRESYDTVAADYVKRFATPDAMDPVARAMFAPFAELVRTADRGPVADLAHRPDQR